MELRVSTDGRGILWDGTFLEFRGDMLKVQGCLSLLWDCRQMLLFTVVLYALWTSHTSVVEQQQSGAPHCRSVATSFSYQRGGDMPQSWTAMPLLGSAAVRL